MTALWSLGAWAIDVVDDRGRNVHLDRPASRIVTLAPHLAELVHAAGGGARLVGVAEYSDFPPSARKLPRVGNASGIDLEGVLALRPDLVAAWRSGNDPRTVQRLEQLGLTVYVTEPAGPEDVARHLRQLGRLMGTDVVAEKAARDLLGSLQGLRRRYQHRRAVSVFLEIDHHPLITVGGAHIISELIAICGGRNALGTLTGVAPVVDPEAVLRAESGHHRCYGARRQRVAERVAALAAAQSRAQRAAGSCRGGLGRSSRTPSGTGCPAAVWGA